MDIERVMTVKSHTGNVYYVNEVDGTFYVGRKGDEDGVMGQFDSAIDGAEYLIECGYVTAHEVGANRMTQTTETIEQCAQRLLDECLDYWEHPMLKVGYILGVYSDGVWVVDASETCDMNKMPRITKVLDGSDA